MAQAWLKRDRWVQARATPRVRAAWFAGHVAGPMTAAVASTGPQKARLSPGPVSSRSDSGRSKSPKRRLGCSASSSSLTLEEENELRQFLKLVRGVEWGRKKRKHGKSQVSRVIEKLKAIGVSDVSELLRRVSSRRINEELAEAGYAPFSKDTLESIRKQSSFIRALEHLNEAHYRQIGPMAPAPQMLTSENLVYKAAQNPSGLRASLSSARPAPDVGNGSPPRRRQGEAGTMSKAGTGVSSAFLYMCSEEAPMEDGLVYMPLHLRGARHKSTRKSSVPKATSASLPDLPRPELRMAQVQARLSTPEGGSHPRPLASSPSGDSQSGPQRGLRPHMSLGTFSAATSESVRTSPVAGAAPEGLGSPTRAKAVTFKAPTPALDTPRLMERLQRASEKIAHEQRAARWTSLNHSEDSLLQHGEAMLKEQVTLEARQNLFREMESEGVTSPLRQHIARKIRGRLREEQERDSQGTLDQVEIQQRSINIRKHLGLMSNLRRELQVLKRNAFDEEDDTKSKPGDELLRGTWKSSHR
uniref:Uncharacterized protein n=1 Tax=Alexandrium monilatum TaxID=311494 RepID=A0A7S4VI83_9DINO